MWEGDEEETNFNGQETFVEGGYGSMAVWVLNSRQEDRKTEGQRKRGRRAECSAMN